MVWVVSKDQEDMGGVDSKVGAEVEHAEVRR